MRPDGREFAYRATKKIIGIIIGVLIFIPLAIFIFSDIVFHLWNWLMPMLFHLPLLTSLWQAIGLMVLSWLLFGGLRGLSGPRSYARGNWRTRMNDCWEDRWDRRWQQMSPEERERFREWVRTRFGQVATDAPHNV